MMLYGFQMVLFLSAIFVVHHYFRKALYEMGFQGLLLKLAFMCENCGNESHAGSYMMSC